MEFNLETFAFREANRQFNDKAFSSRMSQLSRFWCLRRLLKLPAELRLMVYEQMTKEDVLLIHPGDEDEGFHATSVYLAQLHGTSRRVYDEYSCFARNEAFTIETGIRDFDFSHVEAFLDHLSAKGRRTLPTLSNGSLRRFSIHLSISRDHIDPPDGLTLWLDRFERDENGVGVEFNYRALDPSTRRGTNNEIPAYRTRRMEDLQRRLTSVMWPHISLEPAVEAGWIAFAFGRHGSYPRTRYTNLQDDFEREEIFHCRRCALSERIWLAKDRDYSGQRKHLLASIQHSILEVQQLFEQLGKGVAEMDNVDRLYHDMAQFLES